MKIVPTDRSELAVTIFVIAAVPVVFSSAAYCLAGFIPSLSDVAVAMDARWFCQWRLYHGTALLGASLVLPFLRNWYGLWALLSLLVSVLLLLAPRLLLG